MSTQDLIEFSEEDGDDEDVQAILAALQSRKEKQQKLKKNIRDRANKSQKQLKEDAEAQDPNELSLMNHLNGLQEELGALREKASMLPPISADVSKQEEEELATARQVLRELGKMAMDESQQVETVFNKRLRKVSTLLVSEARRSRNEEVIKALTGLSQEVDQAIQSLKGASEG